MNPIDTQEDVSGFKVFIRIRPMTEKEISVQSIKKKIQVIKKQENTVWVLDPDSLDLLSKKDRGYDFDEIFDENSDNKLVYKSISPILLRVSSGFNGTIFAYGMTGSGKSHTMFGDINLNPGVIPQLVSELFQTQSHNSIRLSYLEIYNEHIHDLLIEKSGSLMIFEDPTRGFFVADLSRMEIHSMSEMINYIMKGNERRVMAATSANAFSSRSHAIIQLWIETSESNENMTLSKEKFFDEKKSQSSGKNIFTSKLSLIDLAGSERASVNDNRGLRMKEGANINRSLLALGACINILSDGSKRGTFVPYRDSKLTRLLKDSLGGNTLTIMVACISPSVLCYDETVNTLKYASRAKKIERKITRNIRGEEIANTEYQKIIENLKGEIESLKTQLQKKESVGAKLSNERIFEELGQKVFQNLEENWEISQTIRELEQLKLINQKRLKELEEKRGEIEGGAESPSGICQEITSLSLIMTNNEKVYKEMHFTLMKNLEEKKNLQESLSILTGRGGGGGKFEEESIQETKMQQMSRELEEMKKKLAEKDLLISKNNELINILKKHHEHSNTIVLQPYPLSPQGLIKTPKVQEKFSPVKIPIRQLKSAYLTNIGNNNYNNYENSIGTSQKSLDAKLIKPRLYIPEINEKEKMSNTDLKSSKSISISFKPNELKGREISIENFREEKKKKKILFGLEKLPQTDDCLKIPNSPITNEEILKKITEPEKKIHEFQENDIQPHIEDNYKKSIFLKRDILPLKPENFARNSELLKGIELLRPEMILKNCETSKDSLLKNSPLSTKSPLQPSSSPLKATSLVSSPLKITKKVSAKPISFFKPKPGNESFEDIKSGKDIPVMKAKLFNKLDHSKTINSTKMCTPNSASGPNLFNKSNSGNNSIKININIKTLDSARENFRNFKIKLGKISSEVAKERINEDLEKEIKDLLIDYDHNLYVLNENDKLLVDKMKNMVNLQENEGRPKSSSFNLLEIKKQRSKIESNREGNDKNELKLNFNLNKIRKNSDI